MTSTAQSPNAEWQPFREPLRATLTRTIGIALVAGALFSQRWGGMSRWPIASVVMLGRRSAATSWSSGSSTGSDRAFRAIAPCRSPCASGSGSSAACVFALAMWLTAAALTGRQPAARPVWWIGGLVFIGIELVAQLVLYLRGQPELLRRTRLMHSRRRPLCPHSHDHAATRRPRRAPSRGHRLRHGAERSPKEDSAAAARDSSVGTNPPARAADSVVTEHGLGPLRTGMTIAEATTALGGALVVPASTIRPCATTPSGAALRPACT